MYILNFAISVLMLFCSVCMAMAAFITPSGIQMLSVCVFSFMSLVCSILVAMTYRELKEQMG
ncbi:membrane protein [gut metagenome]|uniref:Membrane protein n=1 Tax=gut metagenome TaxID=749906 RepID=J9FJ46_9ZZZZ